MVLRRRRRLHLGEGEVHTGDREQGAVAIIVAVTCTLLMTLAAIVVDLGMAQDNRRLAQNAADSAALAAAEFLSRQPSAASITTADRAAATGIASRYVTNNGWTEQIAGIDFDPVAMTVTVRLNGRREAPLFSGLTGSGTPTVSARAQASWRATARCSLCVFGLMSVQNGNVFDTGGSVAAGRITVNAQGEVRASATANGVIGAINGATGRPQAFTPAPTRILTVPDPFQGFDPTAGAAPLVPLGVVPTTPGGPNCGPGTYTSITGCETLSAGVYVVTGTSRWTGNRARTATGAFLYFTCSRTVGGRTVSAACTGGGGGSLFNGGTADVTLSAPTNPAFRGLAVMYDPRNSAQLSLRGNATNRVTGSVYAKGATWNETGGGQLTVSQLVVVGATDLNGNGSTTTVQGADPAVSAPAPGTTHLTQ